ncbi:MAG TPA: AlwI family type II restriction endonuclease [Patescibacteria group bacterium]|uniref:Restriction endonuclease n=1 Tax=Candidatus Woesebacteria bacterium RBG_13_46_13 TaxID=1802479 RepID=A0A1F7X3N6_9BACT|nr:MAG: hypothetical protein A2Y68_03060 [Candidatus Woesebacteria bacterium RBG_13_46_13]HJX59540.1 AlwI family type II restriction endonuclease [Patescibacteria group bacterium]
MSETKHTWSVSTSPRNPYKLSDELALLARFEGKKWDSKIQEQYARLLAKSGFFEGKIYEKEPSFSARDRINRSPKTLGFVRFDDEKKIQITPAGRRLIEKRRLDDLFLRQLLKWQYPSPKHWDERYKDFRIKPFLEILRLVYDLDGLSKREIAMFGITLIDYQNYEGTKKEILDFRKNIESIKNSRDKKALAIKTHLAKYVALYLVDINKGSITLRQRKGRKPSIDDFVKTKMRNSIDYADAAIRYFRATGLFTISGRTYRLEILDTKTRIVRTILKTFPREPEEYEKSPSVFLDFLGNSNLPSLPEDDVGVLREEIIALVVKIRSASGKLPKPDETYSMGKLTTLMIDELWGLKTELEQVLQSALINEEVKALQTYKLYPDIIGVFNKIQDRGDIDIPDKPLFFEWNTWRALNMLDDGNIIGNLSIDNDGRPLHNAPPKLPDLVCYYNNFVLVVEVTLSTGARQYDSEGEPVARHLGDVVEVLRTNADKRPVFGLFLAPSINPSVVALFFVLRKTNVVHYGGKAQIIPLNLDAFKKILDHAYNEGGVEAEQIYSFLKWASSIADNFDNETEWFNTIIQTSSKWTNLTP